MRTILEADNDFFCDIKAPCFQNLQHEEADLVKGSKTQVLFRKGENLTKQGAFASYILFVINGYARQYLEGEGNRDFNLKIIIPGEFVGLSAVFNTNIFNYSSVAMTDCQAYLIEKDAIATLVKQNAMFAYGIIRKYCEQNTNLLDTVGKLLFRQMNGRLAETLLYIDSLNKSHESLFQYLSRKDIADFAGISMESAVKLLKAFEKDGIIELHDKDIILLKPGLLEEIKKRG
ncbi:MAG TPA: Crp/Fnr family transcriptional regulator [Bacteroidales bacterium]|nr:Crp/Fnr family transcriptional regulator [Bacteroidales bacterium]